MPIYEMDYDEKMDYLSRAGFEEWEAHELAQANYKTFFRDRHTYPDRDDDPAVYIQRMVRSRRLNMRRWHAAELSEDEIHARILKAYQRHDWTSHPRNLADAEARHRDPLDMLRWFRGTSVEKGEYIPRKRPSPFRAGSHHKLTEKGQDRKQQRLSEIYNARPSDITDKRDASLKIQDLNERIGQASIRGNQRERQRLELQRNRWERRYDELR